MIKENYMWIPIRRVDQEWNFLTWEEKQKWLQEYRNRPENIYHVGCQIPYNINDNELKERFGIALLRLRKMRTRLTDELPDDYEEAMEHAKRNTSTGHTIEDWKFDAEEAMSVREDSIDDYESAYNECFELHSLVKIRFNDTPPLQERLNFQRWGESGYNEDTMTNQNTDTTKTHTDKPLPIDITPLHEYIDNKTLPLPHDIESKDFKVLCNYYDLANKQFETIIYKLEKIIPQTPKEDIPYLRKCHTEYRIYLESLRGKMSQIKRDETIKIQSIRDGQIASQPFYQGFRSGNPTPLIELPIYEIPQLSNYVLPELGNETISNDILKAEAQNPTIDIKQPKKRIKQPIIKSHLAAILFELNNEQGNVIFKLKPNKILQIVSELFVDENKSPITNIRSFRVMFNNSVSYTTEERNKVKDILDANTNIINEIKLQKRVHKTASKSTSKNATKKRKTT